MFRRQAGRGWSKSAVRLALPLTRTRTVADVTKADCGRAWAVVLSGGHGVPLRPLTRHLYGDDRPKQFAVIAGGRSMLQQTLKRVGLRIPCLLQHRLWEYARDRSHVQSMPTNGSA